MTVQLLTRSRTRLTAWLGVVAVCMQLLAGGVSHWHGVQRLAEAPRLLTLCSSATSLRSGERDPSPAPSGGAFQHCSFCLAASSGTPLLPTANLAVLLPPVHHLAPQVLPDGVAPRPLELRHAPNRAPPLFA